MLQIGDKMPQFQVMDQDGKMVDSKDLIGKKTIIYFYPKDNTSGCTQEACNIRDNYQAMVAKGYNVIGVSKDSVNSHKKFAQKYELPFTLLADTSTEMIQAFGAWGEKTLYGRKYMGTLRQTFIFDENGILTEIIEKVDTKNHASQIMKNFVLSLAIVVSMIMTGCSSSDSRGFVKVQDGEFILDGKPLSFVGANFWYGSIIASEGRGGNRERLHKELDALKEIGVTNLRILVGSDGPEGAAYKVEPVLQPEPGVYNDTLLRGLDYLLAEMAKREMHAVLYFNNSWEWSGGYGQYLQWTGHGRCPLPVEDGYNAYVEYVRQFVMDDAAKQLYYNHVKNIITRTNTVTGKPYTEDPAIFSWQIGNEPRAFAQDSLTKANFVDWINKSAKLIKSLDPNHLVSTGSEGIVGCAFDKQMLEEMHSSDDVDYVNIHIWPLVWRWVTKDTYADSIHVAMQKTEEYIAAHYPIAKRLGKPIVLEEFGYPRDGNTAFDGPVKNFWDGVSLSKDTPTTARDKYYGFVFDQLIKARKNGEPLAGVNFWGWGGHASQSPVNTFWRPGDDYCGDPAQEPQGLFSVYATDASTVELIKKTTEALAAEL